MPLRRHDSREAQHVNPLTIYSWSLPRANPARFCLSAKLRNFRILGVNFFTRRCLKRTDRVVNSAFHYTARQIEVTSSDACWIKKKSCHQRPALLFRAGRDKSKDIKHLYLHTRTDPGHELFRIYSRAALTYTRSHGV